MAVLLGRNPKAGGSMTPFADGGQMFTLSCFFLATNEQAIDPGSPDQIFLSGTVNLQEVTSSQDQ